MAKPTKLKLRKNEVAPPSRLSIGEKDEIYRMVTQGKTLLYISKILKRNINTIMKYKTRMGLANYNIYE